MSVPELAIVSGKGGTGKTSLTACFALLADRPVVADCDVDAADLPMLLAPEVERRERFAGGRKAKIRAGHCTACGKCEEICRFDAIRFDGPGNGRIGRTFRVDPIACEGCGVCARFCAEGAIAMESGVCGAWFVSRTRCGPMVHARLDPGGENSGKLVTVVRTEARRIAEAQGRRIALIDGPPGIGCPVIASITGVAHALVVTEATVSGGDDMERILALTRHFAIPTAVCVNRFDLNPEMAERIEARARAAGARVLSRIRYDRTVTLAQMKARSVIELDAPSSADIRSLWNELTRWREGEQDA